MNSNETKKLNAILILEVIGRPPEHLVETLENLASKMGTEKGVQVVDKKINPPVLIKDQKDFYTSFAEIEVEVEDVLNLIILMFKYMPAHIEIISPTSVTLSNFGWNDVLNELTRRLHGYEEITRILQNEKMILENKLREFIPAVKVSETKKEETKTKAKKKKND